MNIHHIHIHYMLSNLYKKTSLPALLVPSLLRILECTKPKVLNIYAQSLHCWPWLCVTVQQVTHRKVGLCSVKVLGWTCKLHGGWTWPAKTPAMSHKVTQKHPDFNLIHASVILSLSLSLSLYIYIYIYIYITGSEISIFLT